jgi:uncharacterized membrane protein YfcA
MNTLLLVIIGLLIGTIVILFGGGGAAIYLGILTGVFSLPAAAAAATSLVTVLPSLLMGSWRYHRQKQLNIKIGNRILLAALPAVIIGSLCSSLIPNALFKWLIGLILVILGISMLIQALHHPNTKQAASKQSHAGLKATFYGVLGGLMVGVAGMSGGAVILAGLFLLGLEGFNATATSTYVLTFMSAVGALFHIAGGQVDWAVGLPLMIGAFLGAIIAPFLSARLAKTNFASSLKPIIGVFLIVLGIKSLF